MDCHTPKKQGEDIPGMTLAGGEEFLMADGSIVRTANITPDTSSGIGAWTEPELFTKKYNITPYYIDIIRFVL